MNDDDMPLKKSDTLAKIESEDLSSHSIHELEDRVVRLQGEIERVKILTEAKKASLAAADAIFGKK